MGDQTAQFFIVVVQQGLDIQPAAGIEQGKDFLRGPLVERIRELLGRDVSSEAPGHVFISQHEVNEDLLRPGPLLPGTRRRRAAGLPRPGLLGHFLPEQGLVHIQGLGRLFEVVVALDAAGDPGDDPEHFRRHFHLLIDGGSGPSPHHLGEDEVHELQGLTEPGGKGVVAVLLQERVRVVAVRQGDHVHLHPGRDEQVEPAQGRLHPRRVRVEDEHELLREPPHLPEVPLGEGRTERGHGVLHAELVAGDGVEVALDDDEIPELPALFLGPVEAVQDVALAVKRRLGRVQVLRQGVVHDPAAESDHIPREVPYGKDDPAPEPVVMSLALAPFDDKTGLFHEAGGMPLLLEMPQERVPLGLGPAE